MILRNPFRRSASVPDDVLVAASLARGERMLAGTQALDGTWLLGTRDALHVVAPDLSETRIPWESIERADWNRDDDRLVVWEVGEFGRVRPRHEYAVSEPGLLLELVRERVTASVVLQRRVVTEGKLGFFVIGRRAPAGGGDVQWAYEFDAGVDPEDPAVATAAEEALRGARAELGV